MGWMWIGLAGLFLGIALFGLVGFWVIGRKEAELDDGDNVYTHPYRRRWWRR